MADSVHIVKRVLFENIELKALSFVLAAVVWFAIQGDINNERTIRDVPIQLRLGPGQAVRDQSDDVVKVTVRGSRNDIMTLDRDAMSAMLDVERRGLDPDGAIAIRPRDIEGANNARVIRIQPSSLRLELTREANRVVPVKVMVVGEPDGAVVTTVSCDPSEVTIRGPDIELKDVEVVQTELIDIRGRTRPLSRRVAIVEPSDRWEATFTPSQVEVSIQIEEERATRRWENVDVSVIEPAGRTNEYVIEPAQVDVSITGRPEEIGRVREGEVRIFADCASVLRGRTNDVLLIVHVPTWLRAASQATPSNVQVRIVEPPPPPLPPPPPAPAPDPAPAEEVVPEEDEPAPPDPALEVQE
ncbi:MAG: YbbR-like domain-containing protein [Verrucomicrobia bacterium]|nr:YbbR-like domain-containing protein [Verrucomicrobiota bacterium]MDA1087664.1 YbbR-like domain-containing protein [Verrucomicrobiota bacterium]